MSERFLKKKGIVINHLASELLNMQEGDRLLSITEYQEKYDVARGTIQNALNFLKQEKAIVCENHGQLGTRLQKINYHILQKYAISDTIRGTMTLPYSQSYEGLATGIYMAFEQARIKLNMAYIRGSKDRIFSISNETYQFAVNSRYAVNEAIREGEPVQIVMDFGDYTYLSEHTLLFASSKNHAIQHGMKVGIDYNSFDQRFLTLDLVRDIDVTLIEIPGHQIIHYLREGVVDAGIWNYDEIYEKNEQNIHCIKIEPKQYMLDMSASVIACHCDDTVTKSIFEKSIDKEMILTIQKDVKNGVLIPRY